MTSFLCRFDRLAQRCALYKFSYEKTCSNSVNIIPSSLCKFIPPHRYGAGEYLPKNRRDQSNFVKALPSQKPTVKIFPQKQGKGDKSLCFMPLVYAPCNITPRLTVIKISRRNKSGTTPLFVLLTLLLLFVLPSLFTFLALLELL